MLALTYYGQRQKRYTNVPRSQAFEDWWTVRFEMPEPSRAPQNNNGLGVGFCDPNLQPPAECGLLSGTEGMRSFHIMPTIAFERIGVEFNWACLTQADLERDAQNWGQLANLGKLLTSGFATTYRVHKGWYYVGSASSQSSWGPTFGSMMGNIMNPFGGELETITSGPLRYAEMPYDIVTCGAGG